MITYNLLKFENKEQEAKARQWRNFLGENILEATTNIIQSCLYYGQSLSFCLNNYKNIIDTIGKDNFIKVYRTIKANY